MQASPQPATLNCNIVITDGFAPSMKPLTSDPGTGEGIKPVNTSTCDSAALVMCNPHEGEVNSYLATSEGFESASADNAAVVGTPVAPPAEPSSPLLMSDEYFGLLPPDENLPRYLTYLLSMREVDALDEIERFGTLEEQAQGLLQDNRFLQCARGKKLVKKLASAESPARARLLEIQKKWQSENETKKKAAAEKKAWLANSTATR